MKNLGKIGEKRLVGYEQNYAYTYIVELHYYDQS